MNELDRAIEIVGGVGKLASGLDVVQGTVSNWRARKTIVPAEYCATIESLTQCRVTRQHLRPNDWQKIWPELAQAPASQAQAATQAATQTVAQGV